MWLRGIRRRSWPFRGDRRQGAQADGGTEDRCEQHGQRTQGGEDLPPLGGAGLDENVEGIWGGCHGTGSSPVLPDAIRG